MYELNHITVITLARAKELDITYPSQAVYIGVMHLDEVEQPQGVGFESLARVLEVIEELAPRSIRFEGARGEDCSALRECLVGQVDVTMH